MASQSEEEGMGLISDESIGENLFDKLRPPMQEEKQQRIKRLPGGFNWMKANDKENKRGKKAHLKADRPQEKQRSRSRSRSRSRQTRRRPDAIAMRELNREEEDRQVRQNKECIQISDDEAVAEEVGHLYSMVGGKYYLQEGSYESLNWRQRRYLDRLFAREEKKYWEGKMKDEFSFKVFNTIEDYFR